MILWDNYKPLQIEDLQYGTTPGGGKGREGEREREISHSNMLWAWNEGQICYLEQSNCVSLTGAAITKWDCIFQFDSQYQQQFQIDYLNRGEKLWRALFILFHKTVCSLHRITDVSETCFALQALCTKDSWMHQLFRIFRVHHNVDTNFPAGSAALSHFLSRVIRLIFWFLGLSL
jgi:hypothetical protein